jgi:hypothetical protein
MLKPGLSVMPKLYVPYRVWFCSVYTVGVVVCRIYMYVFLCPITIGLVVVAVMVGCYRSVSVDSFLSHNKAAAVTVRS